MSCCESIDMVNNSYDPIHKRLYNFGKEVYGPYAMEAFPKTAMWIFTFVEPGGACMSCGNMLDFMNEWFLKYSYFSDVRKHVKWIIEEELDRNLIWNQLGLINAPVHIFCNGNGLIFDIFHGFPDNEWLDDNILPWLEAL